MWRATCRLSLIALTATLAGCGAGSGGSPAITTAAHTTPPPPPAQPKPQPPDFVLRASSSEGDSVITEGRFGTPTVLNDTGIPASVLAECGRGDGRELAVRLELTTTVRSSLAVKVGLGDFRSSAAADNGTRFVMDYTEGPTCLSEEAGTEAQVELGLLAPHVPHEFTAWVILEEAITPEHPDPSAKTLGEGWSMGIPLISLSGYPDTNTTGQGPHVIQCEAEPFIAIGTPPATAPIGTEGEHAPCTVQTKPVAAL
jgi:hypothetical protein